MLCASRKRKSKVMECLICKDTLECMSMKQALECGHIYHYHCMQEWVRVKTGMLEFGKEIQCIYCMKYSSIPIGWDIVSRIADFPDSKISLSPKDLCILAFHYSFTRSGLGAVKALLRALEGVEYISQFFGMLGCVSLVGFYLYNHKYHSYREIYVLDRYLLSLVWIWVTDAGLVTNIFFDVFLTIFFGERSSDYHGSVSPIVYAYRHSRYPKCTIVCGIIGLVLSYNCRICGV